MHWTFLFIFMSFPVILVPSSSSSPFSTSVFYDLELIRSFVFSFPHIFIGILLVAGTPFSLLPFLLQYFEKVIYTIFSSSKSGISARQFSVQCHVLRLLSPFIIISNFSIVKLSSSLSPCIFLSAGHFHQPKLPHSSISFFSLLQFQTIFPSLARVDRELPRVSAFLAFTVH